MNSLAPTSLQTSINCQTALVVGASRGIGLALTQHLLAGSTVESVIATYRQEDTAEGLLALNDRRLELLQVDITNADSLKALSGKLQARQHRPDLVINCAGILHEGDLMPEKSLGQCQEESLSRLFLVNSIGPLMLAKAVLPAMPRDRACHFAVLSAMVGSISDNRLGGWYGYRASKAALNQFMKTLAIECRRSYPQLCVTAIHPGTTDSALSRPFQANVRPGKLYTTAETARRILEVLGARQAEDSGEFMNWDGNQIPW